MKKDDLTENDKILIDRANDLDCIDWYKIKPEDADSESAKHILKNIQTHYIHKEEYLARNL